VSRLTWSERDHGWRAGPYEIELVAPHLWVCTRRRRNGTTVIEMTGGSLSSMKEQVERLARRRRDLRRFSIYLSLFAVSLALVALAAGWASPPGPVLVIALSILAVRTALKAIDCVLRRSWESVSSNYQ
jgi:hypothetical protein